MQKKLNVAEGDTDDIRVDVAASHNDIKTLHRSNDVIQLELDENRIERQKNPP